MKLYSVWLVLFLGACNGYVAVDTDSKKEVIRPCVDREMEKGKEVQASLYNKRCELETLELNVGVR